MGGGGRKLLQDSERDVSVSVDQTLSRGVCVCVCFGVGISCWFRAALMQSVIAG